MLVTKNLVAALLWITAASLGCRQAEVSHQEPPPVEPPPAAVSEADMSESPLADQTLPTQQPPASQAPPTAPAPVATPKLIPYYRLSVEVRESPGSLCRRIIFDPMAPDQGIHAVIPCSSRKVLVHPNGRLAYLAGGSLFEWRADGVEGGFEIPSGALDPTANDPKLSRGECPLGVADVWAEEGQDDLLVTCKAIPGRDTPESAEAGRGAILAGRDGLYLRRHEGKTPAGIAPSYLLSNGHHDSELPLEPSGVIFAILTQADGFLLAHATRVTRASRIVAGRQISSADGGDVVVSRVSREGVLTVLQRAAALGQLTHRIVEGSAALDEEGRLMFASETREDGAIVVLVADGAARIVYRSKEGPFELREPFAVH